MQELDDNALMRAYLERDSEEAFALLVARHVNKVYSVALRHTGNLHAAEEITQAVFVILARKARHLGRRVILSGWLYQTARLTAVTFVRGAIRRAHREEEARMQTVVNEKEAEVWPEIAPLLDAGMAGLNETDRHAVVLRYFDGKSLKEVGAALGSNEEAAKKRVNRALEKLRRFFTKRGVSSTTAIIAGAISANSVQAAPMAVASSATAVALAKGVAAGGSTLTLIKGALKLMAWAKVKTAVIAGVIGLLVAGTAMTLVKKEIQYARLIERQRACEGTTQINLTGRAGAIVTGFLMQNGQRLVVSNSLPWSFVGTNVSQFEFHTLSLDETVAAALVYDGNGSHASMKETLDSKFSWMQARVENGFIVIKHPN